MIKYTDVTRHTNLAPTEYRSLSRGRRSFSFLKSEVGGISPHFQPTKPMELGSAVHDILSGHYTGPVDTPLFEQARTFAIAIKNTYFAASWHLWEFEVSYTATLEYMDLLMPIMGRLDTELFRQATIDFKITSAATDKAFAALIAYMKYDDQIWNYGNLAQTPARYILPYSTTRKCCLGLVSLPPSPRNSFWEGAVMRFGTAL